MRHLLIALTLFICCACTQQSSTPQILPTPAGVPEHPLQFITLPAPLDASESELSGLAWLGDELILLPQYANRYNALFAIDKSAILKKIELKDATPISIRKIAFDDGGVSRIVGGFEGFEAITFVGDKIYLTIESGRISGMMGYLVSGSVTPDHNRITLDATSLREIAPQAALSNMSDEAISAQTDGSLLTFYEANGANVNAKPRAHVWNGAVSDVPMDALEYRITDATPADALGNFWVINYFYPGDTKLKPATDSLSKMGLGATHQKYAPIVERLVEWHYDGARAQLTNSAPIWLQLADDGQARNWEGIARLDDRGFLLVTDQHPRTLFAFVQK